MLPEPSLIARAAVPVGDGGALTYDDAVQYMSGLLQFGIRLGRERFVELLARLGDPHKRLRCVHVAGTNGKGSTCTFITSVLRAAGYSVGTYLSPYVFDLRERVQVDGAMISREDFARWVSRIRPHIEAIARDTDLGQITEFELKTAVAFCCFAEREVDFAVLEVGIGGRLDATNVIPPPLCAVITHIGLDHQKILGDTLAHIAAEKAGILKAGTECVTAVPPGEALDVIARTAARCGCPLRRIVSEGESGDAWVRYRRDADGLHLTLADGERLDLQLSLRGSFQAANAATAAGAIAVLRSRGIDIPDRALRAGLENAALPGRFQIARSAASDSPAVVLDVAHNEDGARVLADSLRSVFPDRRCVFTVGMSHNHEPAPFLEILAPLAARVVATSPPFRPKPAEEVAAAANALGLPVECIEPAADAITAACATAAPDEVVVVTGSFYTVGETPAPLRGGWDGAPE